MYRPSARVAVLLFVLGLPLVGSGAFAASRPTAPKSLNPFALWMRLWTAVVALDEGCSADPSGRCMPNPGTPPVTNLDAGCAADPSGSPKPCATGETH